jgi:hypothetical protein
MCDATLRGVKVTKQRPMWVNDVIVFTGSALLNLVLIFPCGFVLILSDSPKKGSGISGAWYWMFATPVMAAAELRWHELAALLVYINPLLYGLTWWLLWRMVRLMRRRPQQ